MPDNQINQTLDNTTYIPIASARRDDMAEETRYFEMRRDIDSIRHTVESQARDINHITQRQERHEARITDCIEKLTNAVQNVDKKLDVSLAQSQAKESSADKLLKIGPSVLFAMISGWWVYNQSLERKFLEAHQRQDQPVIIQQQLPTIKK